MKPSAEIQEMMTRFYEAASAGWRRQMAAMGSPVPITGGGATAYQLGDVARVADRPMFHLPDGTTVPFRFTAIWLREPEAWRIIQAHASLGVANEAAPQR